MGRRLSPLIAVCTLGFLSNSCAGDNPSSTGPEIKNVAEVRIAPVDLPLKVHETAALTADVRDQSGNPLTGRAISWSSSNTGIATVSSSGGVTAIAVGAATITATSEGKSGSANVTVSPAPVATVVVSPGSLSLNIGQSGNLIAELRDQAGIVLSGRDVSWSSRNAGIASISASGSVTGVAAGTATLTATSEGKSGTAIVTVSPAQVATITVVPNTLSLVPGQSGSLTAELRDQAGNPLSGRAVSWSTNTGSIATVSASGNVLGVAVGTATITATSEGKSGTAAVTVSAIPVATVAIIPGSLALPLFETGTLNAEVRDQSGNVLTGRQIAWSSSNIGVATVSASGAVTGVAVGTATITATSEGKSGGAIVSVTPAPIRDCATINRPGSYVVTGDIGAGERSGSFCLNVNNTADVSIDCLGHTVRGIQATMHP